MRVVFTIEMDTLYEPSEALPEKELLDMVQFQCRKRLLSLGNIYQLGTSNIQSSNHIQFHHNPAFKFIPKEERTEITLNDGKKIAVYKD